MPKKKIICVILVYYDFEVIKKSLESVLPLQQMMDFVIIENPSEFTDFQIKPYFLGLLNNFVH